MSNAEFQHQIWVATGGGMLVLLQSILSGTRRVWWKLIISCLIGGGGAALAGHVFADSKWVYSNCGVAAIMAENVIFGLFKASEEFKDSPLKVFSEMWRLVMPTFGRTADKPANDFKGKKGTETDTEAEPAG
jgi:hypothetical protein